MEQLKLEELKRLACEACGISDMNNRKYKSVCARTLLCKHLRETNLSLHAIARLTDKTHSSVLNLLRKYNGRIKYDKEFAIYTERFKVLLKSL